MRPAVLIAILTSAACLSAAAPRSVKPPLQSPTDTSGKAASTPPPGAAAPAPSPMVNAQRAAKLDSVPAKSYRFSPRPFDHEEMKAFLAAFEMKDVAKPESNAVNRVYRDKGGASLAYEQAISEVGFVNEKVPMLGRDDFVPDSLIRRKTDELLKNLLKNRAGRYVFANYEVTFIQSRNGDGAKEVGPVVPAFYTGRYLRKIEDRVVLGDAFQVRIGYGQDGVVQAFSFRDPALAEAGTVSVPTGKSVADSLSRWAKSRTRTRRLTYPYHADKLRVVALKPLRILESYVAATEKDGLFLMPAVTVLAQATLAESPRKQSEPAPADPVILHFHFPCRPGTGLCWPDHGRDIMSPSPATAPSAPRPVLPAIPGNRTGQIKPPVPAASVPGPE